MSILLIFPLQSHNHFSMDKKSIFRKKEEKNPANIPSDDNHILPNINPNDIFIYTLRTFNVSSAESMRADRGQSFGKCSPQLASNSEIVRPWNECALVYQATIPPFERGQITAWTPHRCSRGSFAR